MAMVNYFEVAVAAQESLANYAKGKTLAKTLELWPLTLKSLAPWFLYDFLIPALPTLREFSIMWIGLTGSQ